MTIEEIGAFCNAVYTRMFLQLMGYTGFGTTTGTNVTAEVTTYTTGTNADYSKEQAREK